MPGYGYAKVSKSKRGEFQEIIVEYIGKRKNLYCVFVLVDSRIPPQDSDIRFINWLGQSEIPFKILFTKTDKISPTELNSKLDTYQNTLKEFWAELPEIIITSALKKTGSKEIFDVITQAMGL